MKLGITGSRNGLTIAQRHKAMQRLGEAAQVGIEELHHGCCVGADYLIHQLAKWLDLPIVLHPPDNFELVPGILREVIREPTATSMAVRAPLPYLERNRGIVDECTRLLVLPGGPEKQRSGTWSTYRYAKSIDMPIWVLTPEGKWL